MSNIRICDICGSPIYHSFGLYSYRNDVCEEYNYTLCPSCSRMVAKVVQIAKKLEKENEHKRPTRQVPKTSRR